MMNLKGALVLGSCKKIILLTLCCGGVTYKNMNEKSAKIKQSCKIPENQTIWKNPAKSNNPVLEEQEVCCRLRLSEGHMFESFCQNSNGVIKSHFKILFKNESYFLGTYVNKQIRVGMN